MSAGHVNPGPVNSGAADAGSVNTGPVNAGHANAGRANAGPVSAGSTSAGSASAGSASTGPANNPEHPAGATVLIVEDEPSIADVLAIALRYHRFEVMTAGTVREGLALATRTRPDAALLDVMLPDGDGRALGRELRARRPDLALVFLTARDAPAEIVGALGFGDDYITKPFNIDEVVARLGAVLRRTRSADVLPERPPLRYGDLELDETAYTVHRSGHTVQLTPTEYALLRFLVRNGGRVVPKEQLLRHVWQYEHTAESTVVETYISYLRRKLEALGPPLITTRRGVGYGLAGGA
ncbi:winged helix-turn-helix domain-containing protein [Streptomyces sp. NBC_00401]|nr:winged helix-turn-helix domain-containing protein [Streptomyces sp. NBC_00401]